MNVLPLAGFALTVAWAYTRSMRRTDMKRLTYFDGGKWRLKIGNTEYSGKTVFLTRGEAEAALRREQDG